MILYWLKDAILKILEIQICNHLDLFIFVLLSMSTEHSKLIYCYDIYGNVCKLLLCFNSCNIQLILHKLPFKLIFFLYLDLDLYRKCFSH